MTAAEAVRTFVLTLTPVTSIVSGRVFTFRFPQDMTASSFPAVLVTQVSEVQYPHLRGTLGLRWARVQVDSVAKTIGAARALDQAVMGRYFSGAATGLRGTVASVSGGVDIKHAEAIGYREDFDADELNQARVSRDYLVWTNGLDG